MTDWGLKPHPVGDHHVKCCVCGEEFEVKAAHRESSGGMSKTMLHQIARWNGWKLSEGSRVRGRAKGEDYWYCPDHLSEMRKKTGKIKS